MARPVPLIAGVSTSHTAFVGAFGRGPVGKPTRVASAGEFAASFGGPDARREGVHQVTSYFANGGVVAWIVRTGAGVAWKRGIRALDALAPGAFNLLCLAGASSLPDARYRDVVDAAIRYCERRRAFLILDPPSRIDSADEMALYRSGGSFPVPSANGAIYFPRIDVADPLQGGAPRSIGPSGAIAGRYAANDAARGVWEAPAGISAPLAGATLRVQPGEAESSRLNSMGVNVLRSFPDVGTVVWGARTLKGADPDASDWKYVPVRRLALFIEESIFQGIQWARFEPNDEPLWASIRQSVGVFLHELFRAGAFVGATGRDAYFVRCDSSTMTQDDIDNGTLVVLVGIAPARPAEFVLLRIRQRALAP